MKFKYFLLSLNGAFHFNGIFFFKVRCLHPPFLTICIILETHVNFCNISFKSVMPKLYFDATHCCSQAQTSILMIRLFTFDIYL